MSNDNLIVSVSGVRGVIGLADSGLNSEVACRFGMAFGTMLGAGKKVVIGRDTRVSGSMVRCAVSAGLMAAGVSVIDLGIVTTPGTALMVRLLKADGGVIITASHNPIQYNGIKFLQPSGVGLTVAGAAKLKEIWSSGKFNLVGPKECGQEMKENRTHGNHIDAVCRVVDSLAIASKRFKVVLDSINGAGCVVTPMLLGRLGCEVVHLNSEPNGLFAHEPEPTAQNLVSMSDAILKHKAAVGFAQDPDADRLAMVDETGRYFGEEYTLALCAAFVLKHRKGNMATNLTTSRMIDDIAAAAGCKVFRSPTGEANVADMMTKENCIFAGEGNGGVIDPRIVPVRNSLVGIAYILQYMAETGLPLSKLVDQITPYHMVKLKMNCPADAAAKVAAATKQAFASRPGVKFNEQDGLRIDLPESWLIVRGSNTEPIIRIFAEAKDEKAANALASEVKAIAEKIVG